MKLSARNQLQGKVVEVHKGATTAHVLIDLGHGAKVMSSITNEGVDELGLKAVLRRHDRQVSIAALLVGNTTIPARCLRVVA